MDADKAKELKKYTRQLLKDHEKVSEDLRRAEERAAEQAEQVKKLTAEVERSKDEEAPNNYLFGELVRVREKAHESEVAAQRLERRLSMAEDVRAVDVARARAASSRALAEAMAALRRRSAIQYGEDPLVEADPEADEAAEAAKAWDR
eukprot:CAMPEP_0119285138 /NCGR_PEP_ID=MMETSP1329-20130426/31651_1 /TAXON_ID=114041 /ORGANISM="Genus nov. species nov., Strain RCC1024" /LENGTH=147 /DNA_ID=CAMNT_0007285845 /DNA_START=124 /DNA_END=564 /DNA_ORIENTATION=+